VSLDYETLKGMSPEELSIIRDSKSLSGKQRQRALKLIEKISLGSELGIASVREIEKHGILGATFLAMRRAISKFKIAPSTVLVDGNLPISGYDGHQIPLVRGDSLSYAIAAASIVAKEARDEFMREESQHFPGYGFEDHVGYGTKRHMESIDKLGICPLHRQNFAPIAARVQLPS
jgi:ribonuclease HII